MVVPCGPEPAAAATQQAVSMLSTWNALIRSRPSNRRAPSRQKDIRILGLAWLYSRTTQLAALPATLLTSSRGIAGGGRRSSSQLLSWSFLQAPIQSIERMASTPRAHLVALLLLARVVLLAWPWNYQPLQEHEKPWASHAKRAARHLSAHKQARKAHTHSHRGSARLPAHRQRSAVSYRL